MQPIAILTDKVLQYPPILELHECHMRRCWDGCERVNRLASALSSLSSERPVAFWTAEVGDACNTLDDYSIRFGIEDYQQM